ncbi:MAG TPA: adenylate/guanylate cyclase domain-containing protein [Gaiellaceae bacterium]|nr:adenylate/guanylate cyclase domain-containing protein [Gaiellaceae bacterium]
MRELPGGRVTLLFTDVEGSTRLLHELGDGYADVLADHRRTLREAFARHHGTEVDTQGDAFFYVFPSAEDAVAAAGEGSELLVAGPIHVRIGVHTGTPQLTSEGYVGADVHLAARIGAVGHGGQVVLSDAAHRELGAPPELLDLGEHRLKDFDDPVPLYQLGSRRFPPLKTIANTNLPRPASSFVGRAGDAANVVARIRGGARLLTLTGPGGSGKTRLAIEAATELVSEFRAGVFWVELAPIADAELVLEEIGRTLGARDDLARDIGERELLLVIDNFEQVVDGGPAIGGLVSTCPNLHVLVTSRELLRLQHEVEYPVDPLPSEDASLLFAERSGLTVDETVTQLCAALDNLPLAVELAAARTDVLSPAQILERLEQRLDLFRGARDVDARQQTLRAAIQWSHDLLDGDEQLLFARLAVFAGGCTLEAAEAVADAQLDVLEALVQKSLVRHSGERFWMLETIRGYALERLAELGEADALRRRHGEWFLAFAERAEPFLDGPDQAAWLGRLEDDAANLREAAAEPALAGRFAAALRFFWAKRGYVAEGRRHVEEVLPRLPDDAPAKRMALVTGALLAVMQGDFGASIAHGERAIELGDAAGDERPRLEVASALGRSLLTVGEEERGLAFFRYAADRGPGMGRPGVAAIGLLNLGYVALLHGDLELADEHLRQSVDLAASCGELHAQARSLAALSSVALEGEHLEAARELARESLAVAVPMHDRDTACWALELAGCALAAADPDRAARLLGAADEFRAELGGSLTGLELAQHERALAFLSSSLDADALTATWQVGRKLSLEDAAALVG